MPALALTDRSLRREARRVKREAGRSVWRRRLAEAGERAAAAHLERGGMRIVERNYRCTAGEVDLIALDGGTVAFVEVKLRHPPFDPLEAVDGRKRRQVCRAAFDFLLRRGMLGRPARFDVVAVEAGTYSCTHIADAFDSDIEY
jgi:putative endonuclease